MHSRWPVHELGELVEISSGGTPSKANASFWGGTIPWISAKDLKRPWLHDSIDRLSESGACDAGLVPKGTVLVLVRGMTLFRDVPVGLAMRDLAFNQDIKALSPRKGLEPEFLLWALSAQKSLLMRQVDSAGHGTGRLNTDALLSCPIPVPPVREQRQIAEILCTWDKALEKLERLIAAKKLSFDRTAVVLLSGHKRITRTRSKWRGTSLIEVTTELTVRNGGQLGPELVMGVNKVHGMIPMKDHVRAADLSRYKVTRPFAFAYNPMRLNIGSIAQNLHGQDVLVSPDYVAFQVDADVLDPQFFDHLRRTRLWSRFVESAGSGGVRIRIYYEDLADFGFDLPPLAEQRAMVEILNTGRREIALLEKQRDALSRQRGGLLRKLLSGEWRFPLNRGEAEAAA